MDTKPCACGCGEAINAGSPWKFKRGHKPGGKSKRLPPPSTGLAKREKPIVIDQQLEQEEPEYVTCEISVPQLDKIYNLLPGHAKAVAVLNGVEELD
jgi:hypothetical protein